MSLFQSFESMEKNLVSQENIQHHLPHAEVPSWAEALRERIREDLDIAARAISLETSDGVARKVGKMIEDNHKLTKKKIFLAVGVVGVTGVTAYAAGKWAAKPKVLQEANSETQQLP